MARVIMFAYVLLAGLATPALIFAAGGDGVPPAATGAQATDPASTAAATTSTPAPAPAPQPAASAAPTTPVSQPAPAPQSAPAPATRARPKRASVTAAHRPVKVRAVAHAAGSDTISDFKYTPSSVTVSVGESVTWTNDGPT